MSALVGVRRRRAAQGRFARQARPPQPRARQDTSASQARRSRSRACRGTTVRLGRRSRRCVRRARCVRSPSLLRPRSPVTPAHSAPRVPALHKSASKVTSARRVPRRPFRVERERTVRAARRKRCRARRGSSATTASSRGNVHAALRAARQSSTARQSASATEGGSAERPGPDRARVHPAPEDPRLSPRAQELFLTCATRPRTSAAGSLYALPSLLSTRLR
jgi:hypothetical protein